MSPSAASRASVWRGFAGGFALGIVHAFEGHVALLVLAVFSCGPWFWGLFQVSSALALVSQSVRPLWKLGEVLQLPLLFLGTFLRGRDLLGGHPPWRSVFTGAGSATLGRHSLCSRVWRMQVVS